MLIVDGYNIINARRSGGDMDSYSLADARDRLLSDLMEVDEVKIYPVSARKGIGLDELKNKLTGDAASEVRQILEESARKKLINLINSSLGQLELYWSALKSPPSLFHSRFSRLNNAFNELQKNSIEDAKELFELL